MAPCGARSTGCRQRGLLRLALTQVALGDWVSGCAAWSRAGTSVFRAWARASTVKKPGSTVRPSSGPHPPPLGRISIAANEAHLRREHPSPAGMHGDTRMVMRRRPSSRTSTNIISKTPRALSNNLTLPTITRSREDLRSVFNEVSAPVCLRSDHTWHGRLCIVSRTSSASLCPGTYEQVHG
jgi:hypothetical protein